MVVFGLGATRVAVVPIVDGRVRKLKTQDVVAVETVTLESVNDDRGLNWVFEISEAKDDLLSRLPLVPLNQSDSLKPWERPKEMGDLSLGGVGRDSLDVDCARGIGRNRKDLGHIESRLDRICKVGERGHRERRQRYWLLLLDCRPRQ